MISKIRNDVIKKMGINIKFRFNGTRNQIEEFNGEINGVYNYIFTIKTSNKEIKSFSYSDILIGNLEFIE